MYLIAELKLLQYFIKNPVSKIDFALDALFVYF